MRNWPQNRKVTAFSISRALPLVALLFLIGVIGCSGSGSSSSSLNNSNSSGNGDSGSTDELLSILLTPPIAELSVGETVTILAEGNFASRSEELTHRVTWTYSEPGLVQVDEQGQLQALAEGETQVFAQHEGVQSNPLSITVNAPTVSSLVISVSPSTMEKGQSANLTAMATYSSGSSVLVTDQVQWTSSDENILQISNGSPAVATALQVGQCTISASLNGVSSAALPVLINPAAAELTALIINGPTEALEAGATATLTVTGQYDDNSNADLTPQITWSNTEPEVASIIGGAQATLTALTAGETRITAEVNGISSEPFVLTVEESETTVFLRMNAGGPALEINNEEFALDADFDGNSGFTEGNVFAIPMGIAGTDDDELYQTQRWGNVKFQAVIPNGAYQVLLHFAELTAGPGDRIFDVTIEDQVVDHDLDIAQVAGFGTALVRTYNVAVTDSLFELETSGSAGFPILSGIEILAMGALPEPSLVSISISPTTRALFEGETTTFTLTANYDFGPSQNISTTAAWSSNNPAALSSDGNGHFTAQTQGVAVVSAVFEGMQATAGVTVSEAGEVNEAVIFARVQGKHLWRCGEKGPRMPDYIDSETNGNIMKLEPATTDGVVTNLTNLPEGVGAVAMYPHVSPDGQWILFVMRHSWDQYYQIYRMHPDGSELTQVTFPPSTGPHYDHLNPIVIGGNRIACISNKQMMRDEYGKRAMYTIMTMDWNGGDIREHIDGLSGSYDLNCLNDGTILFSRWDYRPLHNRVTFDNFSLWSMNGDGTDMDAFWGLAFLTQRSGNSGFQDWRRPHQLADGRIVCTGVGRFYTNDSNDGGFVSIVDPYNLVAPYTNITPWIPETALDSSHGRFLEAVPFQDDKLITSFSSAGGLDFNLYQMDIEGDGHSPLLTENDYHLIMPRIVTVRPTPPVTSSSDDPSLPYGILSADNVFLQADEHKSPRVAISNTNSRYRPVKVRLLEGISVHFNAFYDLSTADTTMISDIKAPLHYKVLGTAPIHEDGSFAAKIPADVPILIQLVNNDEQVIQQMPIWTMVGRGETKRCIGCHDDMEGGTQTAPTNLALQNTVPELYGEGVFDFQDELSPILANKCGSCHSGPTPPHGIDLSGDRTLYRDMSYRSLGKVFGGRFGRPSWEEFTYLASKRYGIGGVDSFLLNMLSGTIMHGANDQEEARLEELHPTHAGLLTPEEMAVVAAWCALPTLKGNPVYRFVPQGTPDNHNYPQPDMNLWANEVEPMLISRCTSCHNGYPTLKRLPKFTTNTMHPEFSVSVNHFRPTALLSRAGINSNFDNPEWSPMLRKSRGLDGHPQIFSSDNDIDYQNLKQWIESGSSQN